MKKKIRFVLGKEEWPDTLQISEISKVLYNRVVGLILNSNHQDYEPGFSPQVHNSNGSSTCISMTPYWVIATQDQTDGSFYKGTSKDFLFRLMDLTFVLKTDHSFDPDKNFYLSDDREADVFVFLKLDRGENLDWLKNKMDPKAFFYKNWADDFMASNVSNHYWVLPSVPFIEKEMCMPYPVFQLAYSNPWTKSDS